MSHQSKAKEHQNFQQKPKFRTCSECSHFRSDIMVQQAGYELETNLRCSLGRFKTGKTSTCDFHHWKDGSDEQ